jgi:hypothetical protein
MDHFVWISIQSVEELERIRMNAMEAFLDDYDLGKRQGRYVDAELPSLPFADQSFDLALCSHFLFLYTEHLPEDFHRHAIIELRRVAAEVRVFPLLNLAAKPSPYVSRLASALNNNSRIFHRDRPVRVSTRRKPDAADPLPAIVRLR